VPVLVYLLFLLHFALFSYHFICFFASNCLQISWFTDLLEGVISYNPPVRKSAFLAFDHFLIEPPPSLQHCAGGYGRLRCSRRGGFSAQHKGGVSSLGNEMIGSGRSEILRSMVKAGTIGPSGVASFDQYWRFFVFVFQRG